MMPLFVDDNELKTGVVDYLRKFNADITVQRLQSGDYVFGDIAIERKCINDLMLSVRPNVNSPGHSLWTQLKVMSDTYKQPMLLIEGNIDWDDRFLSGVLTTLYIFWKYQIIFSSDQEETAKIVTALYEKYGRGKSGKLPPAAVRKPKTIQGIMMEMLQCIEHLGPTIAQRIMAEITHEEFVTLDIFQLDERLRGIQGLHKSVREKITQVFRNGVVEG